MFNKEIKFLQFYIGSRYIIEEYFTIRYFDGYLNGH